MNKEDPQVISIVTTGTVTDISEPDFCSNSKEGQFEDTKVPQNLKEEDEESLLSTVESNNQDVDLNNLDLSEYCVSSDAETEKMGDNDIQDLDGMRPNVSDLVKDIQEDDGHLSDQKRELEEENTEEIQDRKRTKLEDTGPVETIPKETPVATEQHSSHHDDDENEAGDEGEGEDDDEEEEEETKRVNEIPKREPEQVSVPEMMGQDIKELEQAADEEEEEEVEEDQIEEDEEDNQVEGIVTRNEDELNQQLEPSVESEDLAKIDSGNLLNANIEENQDFKPISPMPSPIEIEQQRLNALKEITGIEYKFAELRQRLYENKLLKLQTELQMCLEGSHPELQTYYQKIASIRDYKLRRAYQRQKYELQCIDKGTRATRTFIHQGFYCQAADLRSQLLTETTQKWYDINKERRDMDVYVPEISYHVPIKIGGKTLSCITGYAGPAQQRYPGEPLAEDLECENINFRYRSNAVDKLEVIVDRMRLNNELSDLEGLKKYFEAFPGAPNLSGLRDSEIYDDLREMQLQR